MRIHILTTAAAIALACMAPAASAGVVTARDSTGRIRTYTTDESYLSRATNVLFNTGAKITNVVTGKPAKPKVASAFGIPGFGRGMNAREMMNPSRPDSTGPVRYVEDALWTTTGRAAAVTNRAARIAGVARPVKLATRTAASAYKKVIGKNTLSTQTELRLKNTKAGS